MEPSGGGNLHNIVVIMINFLPENRLWIFLSLNRFSSSLASASASQSIWNF